MKKTFLAASLLTSVLLAAGCGGTKPDKKTTKQTTPQSEQPARVVSSLPFKEIDPAQASKGVDPGRLLINASGKDSSGSDISLADYRGKVILLDTWASW